MKCPTQEHIQCFKWGLNQGPLYCHVLSFLVRTHVKHTMKYSKTCVKRPLLKRLKTWFQDQLWLNAGQKYCRMLPLEHSAILLTCMKLPIVIKIFVLCIMSGCFTQVLLYPTKGYNTVFSVRLEPWTTWSQVIHSTTELLCSSSEHYKTNNIVYTIKDSEKSADHQGLLCGHNW